MTTILDMLNEDCWRLVLDFVPTSDIIRSECVSHSWQAVIHRYLQAVGISIEYVLYYHKNIWYGHNHKSCHKYRICKILKKEEIRKNDTYLTHLARSVAACFEEEEECTNSDSFEVIQRNCPNVEDVTQAQDTEQFKKLISKWGTCIKKVECTNSDSFEVIQRNCPNVEDFTFSGSKDIVFDILTSVSPKTFKKLKRVDFRGFESAYFTNDLQYTKQLTDKYVKHWLENNEIEKLTIWEAKEITGKFLLTPQAAKLKGICLKDCGALELNHLLSATNLTRIRKLELIYIPTEIFKNIHTLLDLLPDLEDLCLRWKEKIEMGDDWAESIGRLRLRRLDVGFNPNVTDEWLEKASCGFERLSELVVEFCSDMNGRGAAVACGVAGPALRGLQLGSNEQLNEQYVEQIVRTCPNLEWIDLSYCFGITSGIVERVANARTVRDRQLRLLAEHTYIEAKYEGRFPWVLLDFGGYLDENWYTYNFDRFPNALR